MSGIGDATIKVSTDVLRAKAEDVSKLVSELENVYSSIERKISTTSTYWIGDAGEQHRNMYKEQKDEVKNMVRRFREHTVELIEMADVYDGVERAVKELGNTLQGDVIE